MVHESIKTSKFQQLLELNETLNNFGTTGSGVIQTPTQFMSSSGGSNWDYCICEAFKITDELGIPVKCYSLEIGDEFINFIVFKNELFWYWFESFDKNNIGIHEFHSWVRLMNFITHKYCKERSNFKLVIREINPLDMSVFGIDDESYKNYLRSNQIIYINDTHIEEPTNYINQNGIMKKYSDTTENGVEYQDEDVETRMLTDDIPLYRRSFNFTRDMDNLKTKGKTFSKKDKWMMFIKKFADIDMSKSMEQQIQRALIKSRMAIDPNEKQAYKDEAIQLRNQATLLGLQVSPKLFADAQPTDNKPPRPTNMDHQEHSNGRTVENSAPHIIDDNNYKFNTRTDGGLGDVGSQDENSNIISGIKDNPRSNGPAIQMANNNNQGAGFMNTVKKYIPGFISGLGQRVLTRAIFGGF